MAEDPQREFWVNPAGRNMLAGVVGDETNPAMLPDASIIAFLRSIPEARASFERVVPTMRADERARLAVLATQSPLLRPPHAVEDSFQRSFNTQGVRSRGPRRPSGS